jgi:hypothetical protein
MQPGDPRADPTVVDLIELAGVWVAAEDWAGLVRTLRRLDDEFSNRFPHDADLAVRFRQLRELVESTAGQVVSAEEIRRTFRRAALG